MRGVRSFVMLLVTCGLTLASARGQEPPAPVAFKELLLSPPAQDCVPRGHQGFTQTARDVIKPGKKEQDAALPLFEWPIAIALNNGLNLGNYVDDDPGPGIKDYMGFGHAYNGHNGTDVGPTGFRGMDRGIAILAAAPGIVVETEHRRYDRNIEPPFPDEGNYVKLQHDDGAQTWYWHLRKNSVTVNVGESVHTGQVIGLMGSSGSSSDAHLHFEVQEFVNSTYRKRDPWNGTFNTLPSLWKNQEPYLGNSFLIHEIEVFTEKAAGGNIDDIPWRLIKEQLLQPAVFGADERVLSMWIRLQGRAGDAYRAQIQRPDGSLYGWYDVTLSDKTQGWHIWVWNFAGNVFPHQYGVWQASILINNQIAKQVSFRVGATTAYSPRFWPIAGRSLRANNTQQRDTLRVSPLNQQVTYALLHAPNFVSLVNDSVVTIAAASTQATRAVQFQAVATDGLGQADTMWYHLVDPEKPFATGVEVTLQSGTVLFGEALSIPVRVSTENLLSLGQVVVEYDSTLLQFIDAQTGAATAGFSLLTNTDPPFEPASPGANKNVLVQVSGSGVFSGSNQEIILLRMRAILEADTTTSLSWDRAADHTFFVTADGFEVSGGGITFNDGAVAIETEKHDLSGIVKYLDSGVAISGTDMLLRHLLGTSLARTDAEGRFAFNAIRKDSVRLMPEKKGDLRNAITGTDAMLTLHSLAFLDTLSASQRLSADVNESGNLSGADAVALLRYLAFLPVGFGKPGEWRFLPPDTGFVLFQNSQVAFTAYLLGDVNLNWGVALGAMASKAARSSRNTATIAKLYLPELNAHQGDTVAIAVRFSSDSAMSFVQFTMAYDSTALQYLETQTGAGANGMTMLVNPSPPFASEIPATNREVVVQFSSATDAILGTDQELARLVMKVVGEEGREAPLAFDTEHRRTLMTTINFADVSGAEIEGIAGKITIGRTTAVDDRAESLPISFDLYQNYPNPFNPQTKIRFALPQTSPVVLKIFDLLGAEVRTLVDEQREAGYHGVHWDGRDKNGKPVASGVYLYQLRAGRYSHVKKMSLLR